MTIVRGSSRPTVVRAHPLPTLQRLVDSDVGATSCTVVLNRFVEGQQVPSHQHDVEEIIVVTAGRCTVILDGQEAVLDAGDAVIVPARSRHSIRHAGRGESAVLAMLASPTAALNTPQE